MIATNIDSMPTNEWAQVENATRNCPRKSQPKAPDNFLHAAALFYHRLGLPITLCKGKDPFKKGWPTHEWTEREIDKEYKLFGAANVGVILGPRSKLVDFDCDGPDSEQTMLDLFDGNIPPTATWRSRKGLHRAFPWHPALAQLGKNKIKFGNDGAEVELLIGPNWQTILPPSWVDGVQRKWEGTSPKCRR
jgi:hypothetical protein